MTQVLLSIGSNIEPRRQRLLDAISELTTNVLHAARASHLYETDPVGFTDQPAFLNACIVGQTELSAKELFKQCKTLELRLGRVSREQWHEREIDIDIVLYGDNISSTEALTIPHARFRDRRFVLVPAVEIAADLVDPISKKTLEELLTICPDSSGVEMLVSERE